jgi:tetratricopeptide (TPR) repeat protein
MFTALRLMLEQLAARRGRLVLSIDDLQWSDADSLSLLSELMRAPALMLVATTRPGAAVSIDCATERVALGPLAEADARCLAQQLLGPNAANAALVADEARGHPLFIAELARHAAAADRGALTLDDALGARVAALGDETRSLMELLAVAGAPIAEAVLVRATGQPAESCLRHLHRLRVQHLARASVDACETYHDRVRAAVLARLDDERRRWSHERLAVTLEAAQSADHEALMIHWRGAGENGRAGAHALRAAEQADAALAFEQAARLYRVTLELDPTRADADALMARLGDALANAGRQLQAADAYERAARARTGLAAVDLWKRAGEQLLAGGRIEAGRAAFDTALSGVGLRLRKSRLSSLLTIIALRLRLRLRGLEFTLRGADEIAPWDRARLDACFATWRALGPVEVLSVLEFEARHLLYALDAGEALHLVHAIGAELVFASLSSGPHKRGTERLLQTAERLVARIDEPVARAALAHMRGTRAAVCGRWRESWRELDKAERLLRDCCTGVTIELNLLKFWLCVPLLFLGELDELRRRTTHWLREAAARGEAGSEILFRTGFAVHHQLADGDSDDARRLATRAAKLRPEIEAGSEYTFAPLFYGETIIDLYTDERRAAWERVRANWGRLKRTRLLGQQYIRMMFWDLRGRAALSAAAVSTAGERRALVRQAKRAARRIERERVDWAMPLAGLLRAGLAVLDGDRGLAARRLEAAAEAFAAADMAMHAAVAWRRRRELTGNGDGGGAWFDAQRIRDPDRYTRMLLPIDTASLCG